jgi:anti-anti-sigma regulatory factor
MDLAVVDALARLALDERRHGRVLRLGNVPPELSGLLDLTGLADVLGVEAGRQPEEREEGVGVEEEGELADPPA